MLSHLSGLCRKLYWQEKKYARSEKSKNLDRASLRLLWIVIGLSLTIGIPTGILGIGAIRFYPYFISGLGLFLIFVGLGIRWIAIFTLKDYFTVNISISSGQKIVKTGIYKYMRHPAYAGSLLSFLGLGLAFSNWISTLVIFIPILFAFLYRIKVEEDALIKAFGKEYIDYQKSTPCLFPKFIKH